ncbi:MAG: [FeFe] hydrogenase H-cluster radical SAM maturase HydG [Oscillospiraceae bacterium]|nr:[FeFe] hydrogenase H-cluster radical SAM maturase HydG [Oscillospiraceae bacterium]
MIIDDKIIYDLLENSKNTTKLDIQKIIEKAKTKVGLSPQDIAILLQVDDKEQMEEIYKIAGDIKSSIYGKRIVMFAPLYVSNYCVNNCVYCGYKRDNIFNRRKLTQEEIKKEVQVLEKMGHKRLALELGEDPVNTPLEYTIECLKTIYETQDNQNGSIRRINVNIAATSVENYKKLKQAQIGTYILFQETYHRETYEVMHPKSLKGDYEHHLNAFDRAMEAGIDDVGAGVLFGLYDPKFEVLALMLHNQHLEDKYGVGFHTISLPRLKPAEGVSFEDYKHIISDSDFKKIIAIIRIAVPYTGMILSTRESKEMRKEALLYGISQLSAGSSTGVGGYQKIEKDEEQVKQFETSDERSPLEVMKSLLKDGYIPSYCTACYRKGRTGDRFMALAKAGTIQYVCTPNALMTLKEYALDYGDKEFISLANKMIESEIETIDRDDIKKLTIKNLNELEAGKRDLYL